MIYHVTFGYHPQQGMRIYSYYKNYFPSMSDDEFAAVVQKELIFEDTTASVIKKSKDDSFIFILTKAPYEMMDYHTGTTIRRTTMLDEYEKWLDEHGLRELEVFRTAEGVTNPNHTEKTRNLVLTILQSKDHFQQKDIK